MPQVYRVKLGDGSVIGPLDTNALRSWFENGLIGRDTPTQLDGAPRWTPLKQALDTSGWFSNAAPAPSRSSSSPARPRPSTPTPSAARARSAPQRAEPAAGPAPKALLIGSGLLVVLLAAGAYWRSTRAHAGAPQDPAAARLADAELDVALDLPAGWAQADAEAPEPVTPPDARWRFASPRAGAYAYLSARRRAAGAVAAPLDASLAAFKRLAPDFELQKREPLQVGERSFESCEGRRGGDKAASWVRLVAWREGWSEFALVGWAPEGRASGPQAFERLLLGITHPAGTGRRLEAALAEAGSALPYLDRATLERLMEGSAAQVLDPPVLLRRSYERLGNGLKALSAAERSELGGLHSALYGALAGRDRQRLADYIDRARERKPLTPADDQAVVPLLRVTVGKLPQKRRERLQELFAKAVAAGGHG